MKFLHWLKKNFVPHEKNGYHPHFLRHESISFFLGLVIVIEIGFFIQVFYVFDKTNFLAAVLPGVLTSMANDERADLDLPPLRENSLLAQAAQLKAEDMASKSYFAHTSPEGLTPWHWFREVGYDYIYAGENLAVNFFESADVAEAWMNSPTHRANIVKENYTEIGIGVASGIYEGRHTIFVAQLFGTPLPAVAAPVVATPTPTPAELEPPRSVAIAPTPPPPEPESEQPTPSPVTPTQTPEPVETASQPEETPEQNTVVLGEEVPAPSGTQVIETTAVKSGKESLVKLSVQRALTSPRQGVMYAYGAITLLALVAVSLAMFIRTKLHHPGMVARGAGLIVVIVVLSIINLKVLSVDPQVPEGNLSANAITAVAE